MIVKLVSSKLFRQGVLANQIWQLKPTSIRTCLLSVLLYGHFKTSKVMDVERETEDKQQFSSHCTSRKHNEYEHKKTALLGTRHLFKFLVIWGYKLYYLKQFLCCLHLNPPTLPNFPTCLSLPTP